MALPTLEKTWNHLVNQVFFGVSADDSMTQWWFALKEELKNNMTGVTVRGSSDSATGAAVGDNVDRWVSAANIIGGGGNHSWICLNFSAMGIQAVIDFTSTSEFSNSLIVSVAGFTGGSVSTRPTATDEWIVHNSTTWGTSTHDNKVLHCIHSTDGKELRVITCSATFVYNWWAMGVAADAVTGWATNVWCQQKNNPSPATLANFYAGTGFGYSWHGASKFKFASSSEGYFNSAINAYHVYPNDISGEYPLTSIGIMGDTPAKGRHGRIVDLWYGSSALATLDTYPNDTSRQFAQFDDIVVPWNGTVPIAA